MMKQQIYDNAIKTATEWGSFIIINAVPMLVEYC